MLLVDYQMLYVLNLMYVIINSHIIMKIAVTDKVTFAVKNSEKEAWHFLLDFYQTKSVWLTYTVFINLKIKKKTF